ncbi:redoxin [Bacteriovorax sp. BSW11_IV]|uniref:redoxin domain-containing protein n=1 Tax=Bacteriovorax sp. BSW11_IV TaxID=1353529 RepID=UPI00038A5598|nr:redoxin domain-containing protein [Bacteriovorax sp. BSW11_IV]EQC48895.1 redoxin [Bacteriovorax sp. BSW11_IV]
MFKKIGLILFALIGISTYAGNDIEGVKVGANTPVKELKTISGKKLNLVDNTKNYVLVFYRGSWCPYCMKQLDSIQSEVVPKLDKKTTLVAISVDKDSVAKKMKKKRDYSFEVVSDPKASSLMAFKIANKLDDELVEKYKSAYKIDVEGDSGEKHHIVAHPGVFIVKNGKIVFADVHTNYKERTENSVILKELK